MAQPLKHHQSDSDAFVIVAVDVFVYIFALWLNYYVYIVPLRENVVVVQPFLSLKVYKYWRKRNLST